MKTIDTKAVQIVAPPPIRARSLGFTRLDKFVNHNYNSGMMNYKFKHFHAFTLAEVLITLAIIGIIAALTIPTLIVNYQKREFASRLSQTFGVLSNAVKMAQVEYGDVSTWSYQKNYGTTIAPGGNNSQYVKQYAEKYFLPYLKVAKNYGWIKIKDAGYSGYKSKDGRTYYNDNLEIYTVELNNGCTLFFGYNGGRTEVDGTTTKYITDPIIYIDVNGTTGPNILGRDFYMVQLSTSKNKLTTCGSGSNRNTMLEKCSKNPEGNIYDNLYCTVLVQIDGWKFADDYPW